MESLLGYIQRAKELNLVLGVIVELPATATRGPRQKIVDLAHKLSPSINGNSLIFNRSGIPYTSIDTETPAECRFPLVCVFALDNTSHMSTVFTISKNGNVSTNFSFHPVFERTL